MKKLNAKIIKRHMLKTYAFWQLDERFLIVFPDRRLFESAGLTQLPETESGYLAYVFLDETMKVAFIGSCDPETQAYQFFDDTRVLVAEAGALGAMLVRLVKPTRELIQCPFVRNVLDFHESNALFRASLTLRSIDGLRDPCCPDILTACFLCDEAQYEEKYAKACDGYLKALEDFEDVEKRPGDPESGEVSSENGRAAGEAPAPPEVPREAFSFVRIRDLCPSAHDSWRAVLMDPLEGTDKKEGDTVSVFIVTIPGDASQSAMLFVDPAAPVHNTDIHVTSCKPARLPWRVAYELECANGDFDETYFLGRSGEDSLMFREILSDLREGKLDPALVIGLIQRDDGAIDFSRELYRCNSCGAMEVLRRIRLVYPDRTLSVTYSCPACGERMSLVKRTHIASLSCPKCHDPLQLKAERNWSGVPDPETEPGGWR